MKVRNDARLKAEMAAAGLDAVVAFSMENVFYLSGALFTLQDNIRDRLSAAAVPTQGDDFLICATNEQSAVERTCHMAAIHGYVEFGKRPIELLAERLTAAGLADARIGLEKKYLMAEYYEELQARLPKARLLPGDRVIEATRAIKTPEHIRVIGEACRATERAVIATFAETRRGETEKAMAVRLMNHMLAQGADTVRHLVLTAGDNARHAHPYPSVEMRLDPGTIIRIDVGGLFGGYGTDIARMGIVGDPTPAQRAHYRTLREAQREAADAFRPGATAKSVYEAAVAAYARRGVDYARDHVGHSMSILGGHDEPMLHRRSDLVLETGMVMALEPIFRDAEGRRYTVEDVFEITDDGPRLLTTEADTTEMARVW